MQKKAGKPAGGSIKIHGIPNGDEDNESDYIDEDWTAGCIGVTNSQIDEIYSKANIAIPILILP